MIGPSPASRRDCRGVLHGAQRRRARPDLSGGPRCAQQPAREENGRDWAVGMARRRQNTRAVRNRGNTGRDPAQVGGGVFQFDRRAASLRFGKWLVLAHEGITVEFTRVQATIAEPAVAATVQFVYEPCRRPIFARIISRPSFSSAMSPPPLLESV